MGDNFSYRIDVLMPILLDKHSPSKSKAIVKNGPFRLGAKPAKTSGGSPSAITGSSAERIQQHAHVVRAHSRTARRKWLRYDGAGSNGLGLGGFWLRGFRWCRAGLVNIFPRSARRTLLQAVISFTFRQRSIWFYSTDSLLNAIRFILSTTPTCLLAHSSFRHSSSKSSIDLRVPQPA